jgi:hypothetical protein
MVADEGDAADERGRPVVDLEHDIDAVLAQLDHLRLHRGAEPAALGVGVQDLLPV